MAQRPDTTPLQQDATVADITTASDADDDLVYPFRQREAHDRPVPAPPGARRRRWPKRLLILGVVVGLLAGAAYVGQVIYLRVLFNRIETIPIEPGVLDPVSGTPPVSAKGPAQGASTAAAGGSAAPKSSNVTNVAKGSNATIGSGVVATVVTPRTPSPKPTVVKAKVRVKAGAGSSSVPVRFAPLIDTARVAMIAADDPDAQNFVVIGVDSRANVPKAECQTFGCDKVGSGSRTDTIMLTRISPKNRSADLLSIPRDLWVRLAKSGKWAKVNAAYAGGATSLISTLQQNLNVPINHLVEVDFAGFEKVVRAVGGVELCFDFPTRDTVTGLLQGAGCHIADDKQAIAYVRSRHYEQLQTDKKWHVDPSADLGRIRRQQLFIRATMQRVLAQAKNNPLRFDQLIGSLPGAIRIDNTFSFNAMQTLADQFRSFDPTNLHTYTVPSNGARVGKEDVLKIDLAKAPAVIGRFGHRS